jgi:hypothetical protein
MITVSIMAIVVFVEVELLKPGRVDQRGSKPKGFAYSFVSVWLPVEQDPDRPVVPVAVVTASTCYLGEFVKVVNLLELN